MASTWSPARARFTAFSKDRLEVVVARDISDTELAAAL
jgi:hypothetical protein